jgi:hypothetical protein
VPADAAPVDSALVEEVPVDVAPIEAAPVDPAADEGALVERAPAAAVPLVTVAPQPTEVPTSVPSLAPTATPAPTETPSAIQPPAEATPLHTPTPAATPAPGNAPSSGISVQTDLVTPRPWPTLPPTPTAIGASWIDSYLGYPGHEETPVAAASPGEGTSSLPTHASAGAPGVGSRSVFIMPTPTTDATQNGSWHGTTSQGQTISFTVSGDRIMSISVGYSIAGCVSQSGVSSLSFNQPNSSPPPITDNSFFVMTPPSTGMGIGFTRGTLSSATSASGTIKISLISLGSVDAQGNPCAPGMDATWTASKS